MTGNRAGRAGLRARLDRWSVPRRAAAVAVVLSLLVGAQAVSPFASAWVRSAALFGDVVLGLPVRPLAWVTSDPHVREVEWDDGVRGQLVLPGGGGPHPALVLALGARAAAPDDPRVVRLTDSLARVGFAVLLTDSPELDAGRVVPGEVDRLVASFEQLRTRANVDPERVGFVGLSAGASLAIVAAIQPAIAEHAWFVLAIGPYFDAGALVAQASAQAFRLPEGDVTRWQPRPITREVVRETLLAALSPAEAEAIRSGGTPASEDGRTVAALIAGTGSLELERAQALVAALSAEATERLDAVSPSAEIDGLLAPLYLLHDRTDPFVPWTHSEAMADAHEPAVYHRTEIFEHVEPRLTSLGPLLRDGWRMHRLFVRILLDAR